MPIKNAITPDINAGDIVRASWLNKLKNGNITVSAPLTISQQGGNYNIALDPLSKDWFLGKITSDAAGTSSDAVYYVRRERIVSASSDTTGFAMSDISDLFQPSDLNIRVVNLLELQDVYSDTTHLLPMNRPVQVFRTYDTAYPWKPKYAMWEHSRPCVNKLYDSASDLSDLSATISDVTVDVSDLGDLASDAQVVFATGHNYVDAQGDMNPWIAWRQTGTFPVKVTQSDGVAGDSDTNCTFDYLVKSIGGATIGHKLTPLWPRFSDTTYVAPAADSYGVAFYDGTLKLWQTLEHPAQSDCA